MTSAGGVHTNYGTIFRMTPAGAVTTLVEFTGAGGAAPGASPVGGMALGLDGNFYGTTRYGGSAGDYGTVFRMIPAGAFTSFVAFTGESGAYPGIRPWGSLFRATDGNFYGTTEYGGTAAGRCRPCQSSRPAHRLRTTAPFSGSRRTAS